MIKTTVKITDKDLGYQSLLRRLLPGPELTVGIHNEEGMKKHEKSDLSILAIGIIHEFGAGVVPERSFIRAWFDQNEEQIKADIYFAALQVVNGTITRDAALQALGDKFVRGIHARMLAGIPPPLTKAVAKRKGHDIALIDTAEMFDAITAKIGVNA